MKQRAYKLTCNAAACDRKLVRGSMANHSLTSGTPTEETYDNLEYGKWKNLAGSSRCLCFRNGFSWIKELQKKCGMVIDWCENVYCRSPRGVKFHGAYIRLVNSDYVVITVLCEACNDERKRRAFRLKSGAYAPVVLGPLCCCYELTEDKGHMVPLKCDCRNSRCNCRHPDVMRRNHGRIVCQCPRPSDTPINREYRTTNSYSYSQRRY